MVITYTGHTLKRLGSIEDRNDAEVVKNLIETYFIFFIEEAVQQ